MPPVQLLKQESIKKQLFVVCKKETVEVATEEVAAPKVKKAPKAKKEDTQE